MRVICVYRFSCFFVVLLLLDVVFFFVGSPAPARLPSWQLNTTLPSFRCASFTNSAAVPRRLPWVTCIELSHACAEFIDAGTAPALQVPVMTRVSSVSAVPVHQARRVSPCCSRPPHPRQAHQSSPRLRPPLSTRACGGSTPWRPPRPPCHRPPRGCSPRTTASRGRDRGPPPCTSSCSRSWGST